MKEDQKDHIFGGLLTKRSDFDDTYFVGTADFAGTADELGKQTSKTGVVIEAHSFNLSHTAQAISATAISFEIDGAHLAKAYRSERRTELLGNRGPQINAKKSRKHYLMKRERPGGCESDLKSGQMAA